VVALLAIIASFVSPVSQRLYWRGTRSVNQSVAHAQNPKFVYPGGKFDCELQNGDVSAAFARARVASGVPEASTAVQSSGPRS